MKDQRKINLILRTVAAALVLIMAILPLSACMSPEHDKSGTFTLVIGGDTETVYTVDIEKVQIQNGLLSVLDYLKETKGLNYTADATGFLTEVGDVKQDASSGTYIYIWTSVESDFDVSEYATTKDYNGTTLTSTGVGTKDMTIKDGAVIYIGTVKW